MVDITKWHSLHRKGELERPKDHEDDGADDRAEKKVVDSRKTRKSGRIRGRKKMV